MTVKKAEVSGKIQMKDLLFFAKINEILTQDFH